jgi:hypothetical protein
MCSQPIGETCVRSESGKAIPCSRSALIGDTSRKGKLRTLRPSKNHSTKIKRSRTRLRLVYGKTGAGGTRCFCAAGSAFLMRCLRAPFLEETALLSVRKIPFLEVSPANHKPTKILRSAHGRTVTVMESSPAPGSSVLARPTRCPAAAFLLALRPQHCGEPGSPCARGRNFGAPPIA